MSCGFKKSELWFACKTINFNFMFEKKEEIFLFPSGDREKEIGLDFSPLCDREKKIRKLRKELLSSKVSFQNKNYKKIKLILKEAAFLWLEGVGLGLNGTAIKKRTKMIYFFKREYSSSDVSDWVHQFYR